MFDNQEQDHICLFDGANMRRHKSWSSFSYLLVETRVEMERDVSVLAEKVEVEALGLLLDGSEDEEGLADWESVGESALVWDRVVLASPVNVVQVEVSVDGEMRDRAQWKTVLVVLELLVINDDLEIFRWLQVLSA